MQQLSNMDFLRKAILNVWGNKDAVTFKNHSLLLSISTLVVSFFSGDVAISGRGMPDLPGGLLHMQGQIAT